jgi:hypothetical protein
VARSYRYPEVSNILFEICKILEISEGNQAYILF